MKEFKCVHGIRQSLIRAGHPAPPDLTRLEPTAVMALFLFAPDPRLLFIQKADSEGYPWRNQMAFPGGHVDKSDPSSQETAVRELTEELGIQRHNIEILGTIGHFQTIRNKNIHAFAGVWNQQGCLRFDPSEISRVIEIPLAHLMHIHRTQGYGGTHPDVMTLTYPYQDVVVWGATARIVHHLLETIKDVSHCGSTAAGSGKIP
jgi:peroxisomal coenzyme A diphosphatase NUDT7